MRESRPCSCESRSPEPPALRPATLDSRFRGSTGVPRRTLLAAGATLALPGCAATLAQPLTPRPACLPRVKVSRDRLIRTLVGLRPYRPSGFVVRAEALGAKRLVHNYGHGGAGITLSWGTSRLAADLGLQGHAGPVAVIGAGVVGLTTAQSGRASCGNEGVSTGRSRWAAFTYNTKQNNKQKT